MITRATATTGLSSAEARAAFDDLKREGQNLPAPGDHEVDQFLESEAFHVRHDPTLTDAKRESIMSRLRAAIGRKLHLDAGTFHAWRNVVAEAFGRNRRRLSVAVAGLSLVFGMAACGDTPKDHTPAPQPSVVASAPATVTPESKPSVAPLDVSGAALTTFGQNKVDAGYKQVAEFASSMAYKPELLKHKDAYTTADFEAPKSQMTPGMRSAWDSAVAKAVSGDKNGQTTLGTFMYFDVEGSGYTLAPSGPAVVNETISNPAVSVDVNSAGVQRLVVNFTQRGEIRFVKNGAPVRMPIEKTASYRLVPAPTGSATVWLIDGAQADYKTGAEMPDK